MKRPDGSQADSCHKYGTADGILSHAWKLDPQPQVEVALGFSKTKPLSMTVFLKSMVVPPR